MKAWDIYTADVFGDHPCVLVSCQPRIEAKLEVVVLGCRTMRPGNEREPRANEVLLNGADGLEPERGPNPLGVAPEARALGAGVGVSLQLAHVEVAGQLAVEAERDRGADVVTPHRTPSPRRRSTSGAAGTGR